MCGMGKSSALILISTTHHNHPTIPSTHTPLSVLYPSHFHSHKGKNGHCGVRYIPHQASSGDGWLDVFWVGGR